MWGYDGFAGYLLRELADGYAGHGKGGGDEEVVVFEDVGHLGFQLVPPAKGFGVVGEGDFGPHFQVFPGVVGHHVAVGVAHGAVVKEGAGLVDGAEGSVRVVHLEFCVAHVGSQNLENLGGIGGYFDHFAFDGGETVVSAPGDAESLDAAVEGVEEVGGLDAEGVGIASVVAGEDLKEKGRVADGAAEGPLLSEEVGRAGGPSTPV